MNDSKTVPHVARTSRVGFGMVDAQIVRDPSLPPMLKLVYVHLATYCTDTRSAFPSRSTIAKHLGISVRSVATAIKQGQEAGLLTIEHRTGEDGRQTSNRYLLHDMGGGYSPGSGPVRDAPGARGVGQEVHGGGAPDAHKEDQSSRQQFEVKDSVAPRHHADARRMENYSQAIERHRQRHTAEGRRARRDWEMDDVSSSWLSRKNPYLGADIENYIDHKWGCEGNVRNLITEMVGRVQADGKLVPPKKILNTALAEARWIDDDPPTKYADIGLSSFTPVLSMPVEEQAWYDPDDTDGDEPNPWDEPCPFTAQMPAPVGGDIWDQVPVR